MFLPSCISSLCVLVILATAPCVRGSELPHPWTAHVWEGRTFYHNSQTGVSQWEPPVPVSKQPWQATNAHTHTHTYPQPYAPSRDTIYSANAQASTSTRPNTHTQEQTYAGRQSAPPVTPSNENQAVESRINVGQAHATLQDTPQTKPLQPRSNDVLLKQVGELSAEKERLLSSLTSIQSAMNESSVSNQQLQAQLADVRLQYNELQASLHETNSFNSVLQANLSELRATCQRLQDQTEAAEANFTILEDALQAARTRIEAQDEELEAAYKEIAKLEKELETPSAFASTSSSSYVSASANRKPRSSSPKRSLLSRLMPVPSWFSYTRAQTITQTYALLQEEVEKLNHTILQLRQNNSALFEASESKSELILELNARIEQFELDKEKRKRAYKALQEGLNDLNADIQEKDRTISEYTVVSSFLELHVQKLTKENAELLQNSTDTQQSLQSLIVEHEVLRKDLEARDRSVEALNITATALQTQNVQLRQQLATAAQEIASLQRMHTQSMQVVPAPAHANRTRRSWCFLGLI